MIPVQQILLWLQANSPEQFLAWRTPDGRHFQIAGRPEMVGYWERFFPPNDHPHRRRLSEADAQAAFDSADESFELWTTTQRVGWLTRRELGDRINEFFDAKPD